MIIWSPILREVLGNMCIAIVCEPAFDVINFEIREETVTEVFVVSFQGIWWHLAVIISLESICHGCL